MTPEPPAAEAVDVRVRFGNTWALRGVDLTLRPGRCLGLVGRNGAGKSTLVSVLSGLTRPTGGHVRFDGAAAPPLGDIDAWRGRIATVFQHSMVVPSLTVAENVFLNRQPRRGGMVDWRAMRRETRRVMGEWGFDVDADQLCGDLTVEQRQIVEIVRALAAGTRCLLLDEPTAALERGAIRGLFQRVRQLVDAGVAVLYISHHLEEVFEICEDVVVLRDGERVLAAPSAELSRQRLVTAMVRKPEDTDTEHTAAPSADLAVTGLSGSSVGIARRADEVDSLPATAEQRTVRLVVEHLAATSPRGDLVDCSLTLAAGECVGVTGLLGAGVATLGRAIAGTAPFHSGRVLVDGTPLTPGRRDAALRAGVGYVPEDRLVEGFVAPLGVAENITMSILGRLARLLGFVPHGVRDGAARPYADALSIVTAGLGQPVAELSGGNQQKVTVARALAPDPKVIVAITPTRGVDVASKSLLLGALTDTARRTGAGLLIATDELDDLVYCDRVLVLVHGELFTEFTEPPFDREALIAATEGLVSHGQGSTAELS
jgi:simple sugar transport system ATP-binding protein